VALYAQIEPSMKKIGQQKILLAVLVSSFLFLSSYVHYAKYTSWESNFFRSFYDMPLAWKNTMLIISMSASVWMVILVIACLYTRQKIKLARFMAGLALVTFGITELLKILIARPRPYIGLNSVISRGGTVAGMGFPSGHTTIATVIGLSLSFLLPKNIRWLVFVWIGMVGVSRMYLGVHAPLDIVGGVMLGTIIVLIAKITRPKYFA